MVERFEKRDCLKVTSITDVTQIWIFFILPPPLSNEKVCLLIISCKVSQNWLHPPLPVTSFMNALWDQLGDQFYNTLFDPCKTTYTVRPFLHFKQLLKSAECKCRSAQLLNFMKSTLTRGPILHYPCKFDILSNVKSSVFL